MIKHTYRYAFIFSTMKRNEFVKDGRPKEVDEAVELARRAQPDVFSAAWRLHTLVADPSRFSNITNRFLAPFP